MSALVGRDPVCDLFYMECYMEWTRRKTEQMAGFVSHPNTQRLNLWSARFNIWKSIKVTIPFICNQSILKEINPDYSLEGMKLKLQYFGHLRQRANSLEKTLMLGKDWRQEKSTEDKMVGWHHQLNEHEFEQGPEDGEG